MPEEKPKKVFISYSWRPEGHKDKVLNLTNALRTDRVDCMIDQGVFPQPSQGWSLWTQQQVKDADFVIIVCSPEYREADEVRGEEEPGELGKPGKGVIWEAKFVRSHLYSAGGENERIIPIAFELNCREYIPFGLGDYNFYELLDPIFNRNRSKSYEDLLRHIHDAPYVKLAGLGSGVPHLPPTVQPSSSATPIVPPPTSFVTPIAPHVNCVRLKNLLQDRSWRKADAETFELLLEVIGQDRTDEPFPILIQEKLLCSILKEIDDLWVKYSERKFGFSVQKSIYKLCGAKIDGNYPGQDKWEYFTERVGWRKDGIWFSHKDNNLTYDISAQKGHLPVGRWIGTGKSGDLIFTSILLRAEHCRI